MSQTAGTPIRVPASAFLLIDSQDRDQGPTAISPQETALTLRYWPQPLNNFTIQKRQPFLTGYFHRIGLTEFKMLYATPNVNYLNNKIIVNVGAGAGTNYVIIVDEDYYTPAEFAAKLETEINAVVPGGSNFVVNWEPDASRFNITAAVNFLVLPYPYPTFEETRRGLYYMMNWGFGLLDVLAAPDDQYGLPGPSMAYTSYIDICSSKLTQYQLVKDNSTRDSQTPAVLARVYLGNYCNENLGDGDTTGDLNWPGCRPVMIHRLYTTPKYSMWNPGQYIDSIDIQLRDDCGRLLYVPGDDSPAGTFNAVAGAVSAYSGNFFSGNNVQMTLHCSET